MNEEKPLVNLATILDRQAELAERSERIANSLQTLLTDRLGFAQQKIETSPQEDKQIVDAFEMTQRFQVLTGQSLSRTNALLDYLFERLS